MRAGRLEVLMDRELVDRVYDLCPGMGIVQRGPVIYLTTYRTRSRPYSETQLVAHLDEIEANEKAKHDKRKLKP